MGRAKGNVHASGAAARSNASRLLSTADPVITNRDVQAPGENAADRMAVNLLRSDEDLLAQHSRLGHFVPNDYQFITRPSVTDINFLASGDVTYKNTGAQYRGHVGIRPGADGDEFVGFCSYGASGPENINQVYQGPSLDDAIKKTNAQMKTKLRPSARSQYLPDTQDADDALLSREKVYASIDKRDPLFGGAGA